MKLTVETIQKDATTTEILKEISTYLDIANALDSTKNFETLKLSNEKHSQIFALVINDNYHLSLLETSIVGRQSLSSVKEPLTKEDVFKAFKYFFDENVSSLASSYVWKLQPESKQSKKLREKLELELEEIHAEGKKNEKEIKAKYQNELNDISKRCSEISTNDSLVNYSPSWLDIISDGTLNAKLICHQCNQKGFLHTKTITKKVGISGGKATAGLLTAGLSLFAIGLSRKDKATEAFCGNCQSVWHF